MHSVYTDGSKGKFAWPAIFKSKLGKEPILYSRCISLLSPFTFYLRCFHRIAIEVVFVAGAKFFKSTVTITSENAA